jgi:hypothetical protein
MLDEVGRGLAREHRIQYRTVRVDLAEPDFVSTSSTPPTTSTWA